MLTQALIIGMTPDQFWNETPSLFFNYLDAYERKQKETYEAEQQKINLAAWLHGIYVYRALRAAPVFGKGSKYPEKPIGMKLTENNDSVSDQDKEEEMTLKIATAQMMEFEQYARLYNKAYFDKEEGK